jgi:hypothetical protein
MVEYVASTSPDVLMMLNPGALLDVKAMLSVDESPVMVRLPDTVMVAPEVTVKMAVPSPRVGENVRFVTERLLISAAPTPSELVIIKFGIEPPFGVMEASDALTVKVPDSDAPDAIEKRVVG